METPILVWRSAPWVPSVIQLRAVIKSNHVPFLTWKMYPLNRQTKCDPFAIWSFFQYAFFPHWGWNCHIWLLLPNLSYVLYFEPCMRTFRCPSYQFQKFLYCWSHMCTLFSHNSHCLIIAFLIKWYSTLHQQLWASEEIYGTTVGIRSISTLSYIFCCTVVYCGVKLDSFVVPYSIYYSNNFSKPAQNCFCTVQFHLIFNVCLIQLFICTFLRMCSFHTIFWWYSLAPSFGLPIIDAFSWSLYRSCILDAQKCLWSIESTLMAALCCHQWIAHLFCGCGVEHNC